MKMQIRKLSALFLILCLLFGLAVTASAEDTVISTVSVSFDAPAVGSLATLPTVPEDANYQINSSASWWYDHAASRAMSSDQTFYVGNSYELVLNFVPKEGYSFSENTQLIVNGNTLTPDLVSSSSLSYFSKVYSLRQSVSRVDVLITTPKAGEAVKAPTVPDEGYSLDSETTYWFNKTTGKKLSAGDVFETGATYQLFLGVRSQLEHQFTEETTLYVTQRTGGTPEYVTESAEISSRTDSFIQSGVLTFSLEEKGNDKDDSPKPTTPKKPSNNKNDVPKTGDSGTAPFVMLAFLSVTAIFALCFFARPVLFRKKDE